MPVIRANPGEEIPVDNKALSRITEAVPFKSIEDSLDANCAGPHDVARVVGSILNFGENEHVKLKAAQLAIEFRNLGAKKNDNRIVFNIQGNNVTLNNLILQE
jgi:hypothetical protein